MKVNLKEYLHREMDLLFVALNAPVNSNNNGHWFSNNLSFWKLLNRSGLITQPICEKLEGDVTVFGSTAINYKNWSIGVTDLIPTVVETDSSQVEPQETDVQRIFKVLETHHVKRLCLMHSKVGEAFKTYSRIQFNDNRYGHIGTFNGTEIYEVPFHSASRANKESYYAELIGIKPKPVKKEPITRVKSATSIKQSTKSEKPFLLPKPGNSITDIDIEKGILRITVDFKKYFPAEAGLVRIKYLGENHVVSYTPKESRSSLLNVGKVFMRRMGVEAGGQLKVRIEGGEYVFDY